MDRDVVKSQIFLLGGLAGFVLAAGLSTTCYVKKVRELQDFSAQHARQDSAATVVALAFARSRREYADSIAKARQPIIIHAILDTTAAAAAHTDADHAHAIGDMRAENVALRVENIALRRANLSLFVALAQSDQIIAAERTRGDSLARAVKFLNEEVQSLNLHIQALKPPPTWFRVATRVVEVAGAGYLGYQIGRRERSSVASQTFQVPQCHTFPNGVVRCR